MFELPPGCPKQLPADNQDPASAQWQLLVQVHHDVACRPDLKYELHNALEMSAGDTQIDSSCRL